MSPPLGGSEMTCDRQFVVLVSEKQARVVALPSQNCVYRQQLADTDFVVKAEIISLKGMRYFYVVKGWSLGCENQQCLSNQSLQECLVVVTLEQISEQKNLLQSNLVLYDGRPESKRHFKSTMLVAVQLPTLPTLSTHPATGVCASYLSYFVSIIVLNKQCHCKSHQL